ncbi:MAG: hypothetical protein LBM93_02835 [Oscillospiraceae bacterium]|nr:hypothetical protein [Oscillospiraceae bacterium]
MKEIEEKKDLLPSNENDFLKFCDKIEKKYAKLIHPKLRDEQAVIVPLGLAEYHVRKAKEQICHRDTKKHPSCGIHSYREVEGIRGRGNFTDMRQKACNLITSGNFDSCWIKTFPNGEKRYVEKLLSKYEVEVKSSRRKPTAQGVKYLNYNVYMIFYNGG